MPMFTHPDHPGYSWPHPTTKEHAIAIKSPWYVSFNNPCHKNHIIGVNGVDYSYRYVSDDSCLWCVQSYASDIYNNFQQRPDWYDHHKHQLHAKACRKGAHPLITLIGSRKCVVCQKLNNEPDPVDLQALVPPGTIVDRQTAKALGLPVYRTGTGCKNGHDSVRFVSSSNCVECHRNR